MRGDGGAVVLEDDALQLHGPLTLLVHAAGLGRGGGGSKELLYRWGIYNIYSLLTSVHFSSPHTNLQVCTFADKIACHLNIKYRIHVNKNYLRIQLLPAACAVGGGCRREWRGSREARPAQTQSASGWSTGEERMLCYFKWQVIKYTTDTVS